MKKKVQHIYYQVLKAVLRHSSIPLAHLRKSRTLECCVARAVLILTFLQLGITEPTIRQLTNMSQQRVNYIKNTPATRSGSMEARILRRQVWNDVKYLKRDEED